MTTPTDRPSWWSSDEWETPPEVFAKIAAEFGPFDLDPCCRVETAKAPRYFTLDTDGLRQPWRGRIFVNPPYSNPGAWLAKANREIAERRATIVVALLPAATDTGWFHQHVLKVGAELRYYRGRIRFIGWRGTPIPAPRTPSLFAIYRNGGPPP